MIAPVPQVLAHVRDEDLDLLGAPVQNTGEEGQAERLQAAAHVLVRPNT